MNEPLHVNGQVSVLCGLEIGICQTAKGLEKKAVHFVYLHIACPKVYLHGVQSIALKQREEHGLAGNGLAPFRAVVGIPVNARGHVLLIQMYADPDL